VDALGVLRKYALTDNFDEAFKELSGFVDPFQLALLLLKLERGGYRLEGYTLLKDPEFNEPLTVAVHISGCNFEEWRVVVRSTKRWLLELGLGELAGKVTIVCIDVFRDAGRYVYYESRGVRGAYDP
jgi:hypothetical protein